MEETKQMTTYKSGFWNTLKQKIISIFFKSKKKNYQQTKEEHESNTQNIKDEKSKKEIMEIYNKVKANQINLVDLDKDTLYKIMLLLNEEIEINNKKMEEKIKEIDIHLYNVKMYTKEIELFKKKS